MKTQICSDRSLSSAHLETTCRPRCGVVRCHHLFVCTAGSGGGAEAAAVGGTRTRAKVRRQGKGREGERGGPTMAREAQDPKDPILSTGKSLPFTQSERDNSAPNLPRLRNILTVSVHRGRNGKQGNYSITRSLVLPHLATAATRTTTPTRGSMLFSLTDGDGRGRGRGGRLQQSVPRNALR